MPVVAALPLFVLFGAFFVIGVVAIGVFGVYTVMRAGRDQLQRRSDARSIADNDLSALYESTPTLDAPVSSRRTTGPGADGASAELRGPGTLGADLRHTPKRLAQLEGQLGEALVRAQQQTDHLHDRRQRIAEKGDRAELMSRYDEDIVLLGRRGENMRRVMALLWRTRAILELRAHLALTARRRPDLTHLPTGEVPKDGLETSADTYDAAADAVRRFVSHIEEREDDLRLAIPREPDAADIDEADRSMVAEEQDRITQTYGELRDRMDRLADTLSYLADRCRTRSVVVGSEVQFEANAGTEGLLSEVTDALIGLQEMARLGDQQLADSALDNLAEDISELEQAGLDARAARDAEHEIDRLLQRLPA